ncbi:alpha,alpha-trehalose-phosphate synthase (UDP-forming) [Microbaculum marinisediminis]|uniref:Trehalose-6-phosphate synthase n=1 Tax=Microbaculum marinisediminis TaxID=2931392 RepID=A0AAW5QWN7_9HYPH|nr:alpha,alpha-trehalose-phosphate synthase (UDP-forming) [Microbaculum sp. A6E488]MCT8971078.1 alpha,alpha-trehalose-phosphate synthase (UDP-forming) [Microbaculum sp. A6E488]
MSRLVVVSNRVGPVRESAKAGGLAVAIVDALRAQGGVWYGWSGDVTPEGTHGMLKTEQAGRISLMTLDIDQADYEGYYAGFSNRTLWPIFHYRLDLAQFDRELEKSYWTVNERFATRLYPMLQDDDVVWVHDYHFLALGAKLRAMGARQPIGFFLHIPFPVPEIIAALPGHAALVRAMLAYDVIGFQTKRDARAFIRYFEEEFGGTATADGHLTVQGRTVRVGAFPIGIDAETFRKFAMSPEAHRQGRRLKSSSEHRCHVIGVDRIDYTKGLVERFRAFSRLLEHYPENRGHVSLLQVAPASREDVDAYVDIREELERITGNVNGRFSDLHWTPIRLITRPLQRRSLAGLYRACQVGLVTPLRDGMNLVAKEYVAAQAEDDPGVLVLSRFAGAAEALDAALIVNPYDIDETAEAIQRAVIMPLDERQDRWRQLFDKVQTEDIRAWYSTFLSALGAAGHDTRDAIPEL